MLRSSVFTMIGLTILVNGNLHGQSYIPLLDSAATWQDENAWASPGPNTSSYDCSHFFIDGDSIVDDTTFWILRRNSYSAYVDPGGMNNAGWSFGVIVALLREDTLERRVYIRPAGWSMDWLLYDFSAGVGPYPFTYRYYQSPDMEVTAVDTVLLADGPHRRINFGQYEAIIEGIGATSGFMESTLSGEIHWLGQLVCHADADSVNYEVYSYDCPCGSFSGVPAQSANRLRIGPSPTEDFCHLQDAPPNAPFLIRSMDGRIVGSGNCSNSGSSTIDMTGFPAAIYLLEIFGTKGPIIVKIIKQ